MFSIPLLAVPSQTSNLQLTGQNCTINVYQKYTGLFFDLLVNSSLVIGGVLCLNEVLLVRSAYLGFAGDFAFYDNTNDNDDPVYTGLGTQFSLIYLTPTDIAGLDLPPGVT